MLFHIRYDSNHKESFVRLLKKYPKLVSEENGKETGKLHFHAVIEFPDDRDIETLRKAFHRTDSYKEERKRMKEEGKKGSSSTYSIAKVDKPESLIPYILKDLNIVENSLTIDTSKYPEWISKEAYTKKCKKERKSKPPAYIEAIEDFIVEHELDKQHIGETTMEKIVIAWYIVTSKTIPGKYQVQAIARTVWAQRQYRLSGDLWGTVDRVWSHMQ
jgi:hypothetical protein